VHPDEEKKRERNGWSRPVQPAHDDIEPEPGVGERKEISPMLTKRTSIKEAAGPINTGGTASGGGRGVGEEAACRESMARMWCENPRSALTSSRGYANSPVNEAARGGRSDNRRATHLGGRLPQCATGGGRDGVHTMLKQWKPWARGRRELNCAHGASVSSEQSPRAL